tara:strand:- start:1905 stop:2288 length:384 start_codon:yes stop_codon:yes gene_type:complete
MGVFDKLAFWKKSDDLNFDSLAKEDLALGMGKGGAPVQDNLGLSENSPFGDKATGLDAPTTNPFPTQPQTPKPITPAAPSPNMGEVRDLELISSKLDTVKAILTSMDQRIANLEVAAGVNKKKDNLW